MAKAIFCGEPLALNLLKAAAFTLVVPTAMVIVLPIYFHHEWPQLQAPHSEPWRFLGAGPVGVGTLIFFWSVWDFVRRGRGTPAPYDPPKVVVTVGPYRWVRNPMYFGSLLVLTGEALLLQSEVVLAYAAALGLVMHAFVVLYEEPTLRRKFGPPYETYCAAVPRWIPRRPPA